MSKYMLAIATVLREPLIFRPVEGRGLTAPFCLVDSREVRAYVIAKDDPDTAIELKVVDEHRNEIASAYVAENTSQIFQRLGLLLHIIKMPS